MAGGACGLLSHEAPCSLGLALLGEALTAEAGAHLPPSLLSPWHRPWALAEGRQGAREEVVIFLNDFKG